MRSHSITKYISYSYGTLRMYIKAEPFKIGKTLKQKGAKRQHGGGV